MMKIIVDTSVAESVLNGCVRSQECLEIICRKDSSYVFAHCEEWRKDWLVVKNRLGTVYQYGTEIDKMRADFLEKTIMEMFFLTNTKSGRTSKEVSSHPSLSEIRSWCEKSDVDRLYLVAVALNSDCVILYCSQVSQTCDRIADIKHSDVVVIKTKWKKSELPETVQWLQDNARHSVSS